jgi:hypothetical protein
LYCMCPDGWHSIGESGRCEFAPTREAIAKAGAFLAKWASWLSPAAALLGAAVPVAGSAMGIGAHTAESVKAELDLTEKTLQQIEKISSGPTSAKELSIGESRAPTQVDHTALRGLKEFLDSLDFPTKPYGGLKRMLTPEEHVLWLCPKHFQEYSKRG